MANELTSVAYCKSDLASCDALATSANALKPSAVLMSAQLASLSLIPALFGVFFALQSVARLRREYADGSLAPKLGPLRSYVMSTVQQESGANSVYLSPNLAGDNVETLTRVRSMVIPCDTMVARALGPVVGRRLAKFMAQPRVMALWTACAVASQGVAVYAMLNNVPWAGYVAMTLGFVPFSVLVSALLSLSVCARLLLMPSVQLRVVILFVLEITYMSIMNFDGRSACVIVILSNAAVLSVAQDALVGDVKTSPALPVVALLVSAMAVTLVTVLIAFGLIAQSSNAVVVAIAGYQWSSYQGAFGFALTHGLLAVKDLGALWRCWRLNRLYFFTGRVHIRIIGLDDEQVASPHRPLAKTNVAFHVSLSRIKYRMDELVAPATSQVAGLSSNADSSSLPGSTDGGTTKAYVDVIVLRESQALAVRLLGHDGGRQFLHLIAAPRVRLALMAVKAVPMLFFSFAVLPGFVAPECAAATLVMFVPVGTSFAIKSPTLCRLIASRAGFIVEQILIVLGLTLMGFVLRDARTIVLPVLYLMLLDTQTHDARVCFFNSKTWQASSVSTATRTLNRVVAAMNGLALVTFAVDFSFGLVGNADQTTAIQLASTSTFTLYQLVCNFVYAFGLRVVAGFAGEARLRRLKAKHVFLRTFNAKIAPVFPEQTGVALAALVHEDDDLDDPPSDIDPDDPVKVVYLPATSAAAGGRSVAQSRSVVWKSGVA